MNILKRNGRSNFRSSKRYSFSKTHSSYSNNKSRPKGNFENLYFKYIKLAKEASSTGDRIQAEYYYQFADHYSRNMPDAGVKSFANENVNETSNKNIINNDSEESSQDHSSPKSINEIKTSKSAKIEETEDKTEENENSLDAVSFISQPAKKTRKLKK